MSHYGYCATCGEEVVSRTRGIPSFDTCENGHQNPATETLVEKPLLPMNKDRDWPENQDYLGKCRECENYYFGPKRSPRCYKCKTKAETQFSDEKFVSPCPPPTPHQNELLDILIEECSEVIKRATKMKRFGVDERQPGQPHSNMVRLSEEVGDLYAIISRCGKNDLLHHDTILAQIPKKEAKLDKYLQTTPETKR